MKFLFSLCLIVSGGLSAKASETCPKEYYEGYQTVMLGFAMLNLAEIDKEYAELIDAKEIKAEINKTCRSLLPKYKDIDVSACKLQSNSDSPGEPMPVTSLVESCGRQGI